MLNVTYEEMYYLGTLIEADIQYTEDEDVDRAHLLSFLKSIDLDLKHEQFQKRMKDRE